MWYILLSFETILLLLFWNTIQPFFLFISSREYHDDSRRPHSSLGRFTPSTFILGLPRVVPPHYLISFGW